MDFDFRSAFDKHRDEVQKIIHEEYSKLESKESNQKFSEAINIRFAALEGLTRRVLEDYHSALTKELDAFVKVEK